MAFCGNLPETLKNYPLSSDNGNTYGAPYSFKVGGGGVGFKHHSAWAGRLYRIAKNLHAHGNRNVMFFYFTYIYFLFF